VSYLNVETLTVGIFRSWFNVGNQAAAAQLALMLLAVTALMVYVELHARRKAQFHAARVLARPRRERVRGAAGAWLFLLCALPIAAGFVWPVALLLRLLVQSADAPITAAFGSALLDSLRLGTLVAGLAVAAVLALALLTRKLKPARERSGLHAAARFSHRALALAYAVPGAVLAVGLLSPLGFFDRNLPTLAFTGTIVAVTLGCVIRFYGVAANGIDAAMARIADNLDDAARGLGVRGWVSIREIYLPLLRPAAATAALLVFVDTLKELPATLALRPFNFDTLATLTHTLTKDERLGEAALPSLTIVAMCLVPIWLLARKGHQ
jgi:iron(III) transport system permease protein